MYYEEQMINGVMCYRTDPDGEFIPYTLEALSQRYESMQQAVNEATQEERKRCADMVPTNWLDPLLSGPDKALPSTQPYRAPDIERLLLAIRGRIRDR